MWRRLFIVSACVAATALGQQAVQVSGRAEVQHLPGSPTSDAGVVVWLTQPDVTAPPASTGSFRMAQRNKQFEPHLLVVPLGARVDFPNFDPFFHNVFSLGDGRPFDLGLYQAGASRSLRFTRAGISYVFCNIHPQMSAVIVTVPSPWYALSGADGKFSLANVPEGQYRMHVWYERARASALGTLTRTVTIAGGTALPTITIQEVAVPATHKNKYGQSYSTASPYGGG